ncbi:MAG: PorP/SprF family type IX secretion system membrane protein [Bacteroidales bacterium]
MVKNLYAGLNLATRIYPNDNYAIQFGITAAIGQKRIDWDGLVFPDELDGKYGNIYGTNFTEPYRSNVVYPDFNFGSVLNYNSEGMNFRIGGSIHHIFQPKVGFVNTESPLYMKFVAHGDAIVFIEKGSSARWDKSSREGAKLNPGILYENQNGANAFSVGLNAYKSYMYLGLWYRSEDINTTNLNSMIFLAGVNIPISDDSRVKIMYSYDYVMNKLIATGGTHEISVILEFSNENVFGAVSGKGKRKNWGTVPCSTF